MALVKVGETVRIGKQAYKVIATNDAADMPKLRADYDAKGIAQFVGVQKPNGQCVWAVNQYQDGTFGLMTKI